MAGGTDSVFAVPPAGGRPRKTNFMKTRDKIAALGEIVRHCVGVDPAAAQSTQEDPDAEIMAELEH